MKQNPSIRSVPVALHVAQQMEKAGAKPGNGNDPVPLSGCVSEVMAEAIGLKIDLIERSIRVSRFDVLLMRCGNGIRKRIGFSDVLLFTKAA